MKKTASACHDVLTAAMDEISIVKISRIGCLPLSRTNIQSVTQCDFDSGHGPSFLQSQHLEIPRVDRVLPEMAYYATPSTMEKEGLFCEEVEM